MSILCGTASIGYLAILMIKFYLAMGYYQRQKDQTYTNEISSEQASQFCIAQPILSGDPKLESTLQSNLESLHKEVNFFWMVDVDDHTAIELCQRLKGSNTTNEGRIQIIQCEKSPSNQNPKTWKLQMALEVCDRKLLVVLDDDTTIDDASLAAAWTSLQKKSLYTGLPLYQRGETIWSDLVMHFVANNSVLTYLPPLQLFEPLTINGMFYVTSCDTLRSLGGFSAIVSELCDDYAMKKLYSLGNKRIQQGISYQEISTSVSSFGEYQRLMHRWNVFALQLFKDQRPSIQLFLAFFLGLPPILLLASLSIAFFTPWSILWIVPLLIGRDIMLRMARRIIFRRSISVNFFYSVAAECLQPFHLISAAINPSIRWRHRTIRVGHDMR